jgi:hypothetical protein
MDTWTELTLGSMFGAGFSVVLESLQVMKAWSGKASDGCSWD